MVLKKSSFIFCNIFILLILLQERFIYLTDLSFVNIISICGLILLVSNIKNIIKNEYYFKNIIISLMLIELYGIVISYFKYSQPIRLGLIGTHYIFIYGFYFVIVDYFRNRDSYYFLELVKKLFTVFGVIFSILLIIQTLVYPHELFKLVFSMRNGLRIQGCNILQYSFAVVVSDIISDYERGKLFPLIIVGYVLIFILQARNVVLIFTPILIYLLFVKLKKYKKRWFVLLLLFLPLFLFVIWKLGINEMVSEVIYESKNVKGTGGVRVKELNYYYKLLKDSNYFGIGILGDTFSLRKIIYGTTQGFYMEDIGVSAFIFKTGFLGMLWYVLYLFKLGKVSKVVGGWVDILSTFIFFKTIFSFLFSVSFLFDFRDGLIYLVILLALIDINRNKTKQEE
jgi:hypothetical protein